MICLQMQVVDYLSLLLVNIFLKECFFDKL